ncbi:MAG: sigma-70 family RNA polymerase sigma factor [Asticcacaulis sp.]
MPNDDFAEWIRPHIGSLARISRAFAAPADRDDLLQELMLSVWKARPAFRGDSAVSTYVFRVAHNRALTWIGRKKQQGVREAEISAQAHLLWGVDAEDGAQLEQLYAAMQALPPMDRSLLLLMLEGMSYADIGALHGVSVSNVGVRLHRARAELNRLVAKEASDEA